MQQSLGTGAEFLLGDGGFTADESVNAVPKAQREVVRVYFKQATKESMLKQKFGFDAEE